MNTFSKTFLLASVAALATACSNNNYTIQGHADGVATGDSVFLIDATTQAVLDTTIVSLGGDCDFSFTGRADTTTLAILRVDKVADGSSMACTVYLEDGVINAHLATDAAKNSVTGTKCNDVKADFNKHIDRVAAALDSIDQLAQDTTISADLRAAYAQQADSLYESDYIGAYLTYGKNNIDLLVGIHLINRVNYAIELPQLDSLVALVPTRYHKDGVYVKLAERVERMKQVDIGKPFIDFAMPTIDGGEARLKDFMEGHKVVVIDFWASWCGPCRREMPNMVKAYEAYKDKGLEIVGVSQDKNAEAWKTAVDELGMAWPQLSPLKGWDNEAVKTYAISGIPNTVVIKDGIIVAHQLTGDDLIAKLQELLDE